VAVGVGSGGTLTGLGRYFARVSPKTKMILADPVGSVLAHYIATGELIEAGSWTVEGIGEDFVPPNADLSLVSQAYSISDRESMEAARLLLVREGILAGSSSGTLLAAALKWCRAQSEPKRVVSLVCDTGAKYLSKVYNDAWLSEEGLTDRAFHGVVRDLVVRSYREGDTVTVSAEDTLLTAYKRMRAADVSQLPVVSGRRLVGLLDEGDLLAALGDPTRAHNDGFNGLVGSSMATKVRTLQADEPVSALLPLFARGDIALVVDGADFLGLVTRVDLINHARLAL
jgi:cystathionine beta-synthase